MSNHIALLYTTVGTEQEAINLVECALANKVAVCANILPMGRSVYWWHGQIEQNHECYVLFKTRVELADRLEKLLLEIHPYDTPAILRIMGKSSDKFYQYIVNALL